MIVLIPAYKPDQRLIQLAQTCGHWEIFSC
jgi:hypothetical protein